MHWTFLKRSWYSFILQLVIIDLSYIFGYVDLGSAAVCKRNFNSNCVKWNVKVGEANICNQTLPQTICPTDNNLINMNFKNFRNMESSYLFDSYTMLIFWCIHHLCGRNFRSYGHDHDHKVNYLQYNIFPSSLEPAIFFFFNACVKKTHTRKPMVQFVYAKILTDGRYDMQK